MLLRIAHLLACLALVSHGRRAQISAAKSHSMHSLSSKRELRSIACASPSAAVTGGVLTPRRILARFLLAFNPLAAFNMPSGSWGRAHCGSLMKPVGLKRPIMSIDDELWPSSDEDKAKDEDGMNAWIKQNILQGVEGGPTTYAIMACYFVQGVLGLASLAKTYYMKDEFGLSAADSAALLGVAGLPWVIKPVYGFLTDGLPILGYRRKPYLFLAGLLGSLSWASLATVVHTPAQAVLASVMASAGIAVSDVVVDSIVVERARDDKSASSGALQSLCWSMQAFGGLASAYLSGSLLQTMTPQQVFGLTATFPLIVSAMALQVQEQPVVPPQLPEAGAQSTGPLENFGSLVKNQSSLVLETVRQKQVWLPVLFIFLWRATPSEGTAFFYFITDDLGIGPEFMGRVRAGCSIASLFGIWLYRNYLQELPWKNLFSSLSVLGTAVGLSQLLLVTHYNRDLGLPDQWFLFGDELVSTVLGELAHIPLLVLAASLCPPGVEGTLFALLMSLYNAAGITGRELGAGLTSLLHVGDVSQGGKPDFSDLGLLVSICSLSGLLPLLALDWLDEAPPPESAQTNEEPNDTDEAPPLESAKVEEEKDVVLK